MLYAIVPDRDVPLSVLNVSESHFALDRDLTFVTLECAVRPEQKCAGLNFLLHGCLSEPTWLGSKFRRLFELGRTTFDSATRVYDFRRSFFDGNLPTNTAYEGPEPFQRITTTIDNREVKYCGSPAVVPFARWDVQAQDRSSTEISVEREMGEDFEAGITYLFRLGVFIRPPDHSVLDHRTLRSRLKTRVSGNWWTDYSIHIFSCPDSDTQAFSRYRTRVAQSSVHLDLEPFTSAFPPTPTITADELANFGPDPTSDIWLVVAGRDEARLKESTLWAERQAIQQETTRLGLFPQPQESDRLVMQQFHVKVKTAFSSLRTNDSIKPFPPGTRELSALFVVSHKKVSLNSAARSLSRHLKWLTFAWAPLAGFLGPASSADVARAFAASGLVWLVGVLGLHLWRFRD